MHGSNTEMNTVMRLNITEETVENLPPIKQRRAFHACEVFGRDILVSGGTHGGVIVSDEVYNLATNESIVLDMNSSLRRHKHSLIRLEETIFGLGGRLANDSQTSLVKWFDWTNLSWKENAESLLSKNSSNLAVTSFPLSAVDCHAGCTCGRVNNLGGARIVGGNEAEVNSKRN